MKHIGFPEALLADPTTTDEKEMRVSLCSHHDYSKYLSERNIGYVRVDPYLVVGELTNHSGWIIHIPIVAQQLSSLLELLLPYLASEQISFTIPVNLACHTMIMEGRCNAEYASKPINLYSKDFKELAWLSRLTMDLCAAYKGIEIDGALQLSSCVYSTYSVPINLPKKSPTWPISNIKAVKGRQDHKILKGGYIVLEIVKNDPKGKVMKCLKVNYGYNMAYCLIKQGKRNHCFDNQGRDISDRLLWQYHVQKSLGNHLPIAKALEFFIYKDDAYLSMDYLEGISLSKRLTEIYNGTTWPDIPVEIKKQLVNYAIQIIEIVSELHALNYVHRDLNPHNFIIRENEQIYLIDFELAYSLNAPEQPPPFLLGSMGYMSPEQRAMDKPTTAQDVFAIGGLLIKIFTGLSPAQFEQSDEPGLTEQLHYFIKNKAWAQAITACRKSDPACRPELALVKGQLSNFRLETLHHSAGTGLGEIKLNTRLNLTTTIYAALGSFLNTVFNSPPHDAGKSFVNGMPGIVYVLCRADLNGFRTKELQAFVGNYLPVFQEEILRGPALIAPGLINGSSGMAIMVKLLYEAKFFSINHASSDQLHELLLTLPDTKLPLSDGLAGHGLAILQCFSLIDARIGLRLLNEISHRLVRLQQEDGSWLIQNESDELLAIKIPGLFYGSAGITYFLIQYASQFKNNQAKEAAIKGLQYLMDCRVLYDDHFVWRLHPHAAIDHWLENGFSGIALVFITGYAHFQDQRYKAVAENALRTHPALISSESLDLLNGLAGLGEVYLEAFKVFGETEWDERATHIAAFLCHTATKNSVGNKYWYTGKSERTDGSLLNGHAGIIHFLMRYLKPSEIQFPIINGSCTT